MGFQVSVHPPQIPRFPPGFHPNLQRNLSQLADLRGWGPGPGNWAWNPASLKTWLRPPPLGTFPLPHRLLVHFYECQRWMGCSIFFAHLSEDSLKLKLHFARVLLYAWPVNLTPFTISTIFTNYITSFSSKKIGTPPSPLNKTHLRWPQKTHPWTLYASESWRLSKIPSVPMSTTSPSSTSQATHHGSPIRCSTGLHKKRGVFKHGDVNIFLFKRLINVEMVSELLVVHLSQNEAYLFLHDSDSSPKIVWLRKESSQPTTLQWTNIAMEYPHSHVQ